MNVNHVFPNPQGYDDRISLVKYLIWYRLTDENHPDSPVPVEDLPSPSLARGFLSECDALIQSWGDEDE